MANALSNPQVVINNIAVPVVPNSVKFTEGKGEQMQRVQSAGGGQVEVVYSDDVESHLSKVTMSLINTADNIDLVRQWKSNSNNNAITITGEGLNRSFAQAALTSDYDVELGSDSVIEIEFTALPAV